MNLKGKKVTVFGMGLSGIWSLRLLSQKKAEIFAVNGGEPNTWNNITDVLSIIDAKNCFNEDNALNVFASSDLIILSPGIPRSHQMLQLANQKNVLIISEIELAYRFLGDEKIIAVTGSNGKTTVVSMLGEMLKFAGKSVFVGGNIGDPLARYVYENLNCEFLVLELSSFQLESMPTFRAHSNIYLNIFDNHTERYDSIEDYANAKFNLGNNLKSEDLIVYPSNFKKIKNWADSLSVKKISIDTSDINIISQEILKTYSLDQFKLVGTHNISNLMFMLKSLSIFNIEVEGIQKAINTFSGVDFRIQYENSGDKFICYNDAKSTNWDATITAMNSLDKKGKELWLIIGGKKRSENDSITSKINLLIKTVDKILLIGDTTEQFSNELNEKINYEKCFIIKNAISYARKNNFDGILLFSPAFPSFDQFKNYIDRGESFHRELLGL